MTRKIRLLLCPQNKSSVKLTSQPGSCSMGNARGELDADDNRYYKSRLRRSTCGLQMENPQSSSNLGDEDIERLIEQQLMIDIEAVMSGRRIDERTGELTSAPLGAEYIMSKLQTLKPLVEDDYYEFQIEPKDRKDRIILSNFMRGCRTNPYPERGSVIKIKLSEAVEKIKMNGGKRKYLVVEKHIQLDYETGAWARIKIYRDLHGMVVPKSNLPNENE
ncbi:Negative elongation factor A [Papilio xuthus]|uniref:Negative elongation factor A n=1 Tax=Papilio xuthus TaxID=66420 RepID=A0A194QJH9_PAPXU|nr:Negative elongation factor A [Papilio xuthus]